MSNYVPAVPQFLAPNEPAPLYVPQTQFVVPTADPAVHEEAAREALANYSDGCAPAGIWALHDGGKGLTWVPAAEVIDG